VGPGSHVLGVQIPMGKGNFEGSEGSAHRKVQGHSAVSCAKKTAEPIEIPFGIFNDLLCLSFICNSCANIHGHIEYT